MSDRRRVVWVTCALLLLARGLPAAEKIDVIRLKNGDRLTCEIKKLDRGVLTVSTDPLGQVSVHWGEVTGVESPREFDLQLASGAYDFGSLAAAPRQAES